MVTTWFGVSAILLENSSSMTEKFSQLWDADAAAKSPASVAFGSFTEIQGTLLSNCPQLFVTFVYYFYNNTLTNMLSAAEYSSYGLHQKPLRVTWPIKGSQQRSTYWLNIPYQYGIPVMFLFLAIHWFASQSLFYTVQIPYDPDGHRYAEEMKRFMVLSPVPLIFTASVAFFTGILLIILSFRRLKSNIPLAGSCSASISAACHPSSEVCKSSAAHGNIMWGETDRPEGWTDRIYGDYSRKGHCSFTPCRVENPSLDKLYA